MHTCHHPKCKLPLPDHLVVCASRWFLVPLPLRRRIWQHYRKGQEMDKMPSEDYLLALAQVIDYLHTIYPCYQGH